jgi:hypothetical protein
MTADAGPATAATHPPGHGSPPSAATSRILARDEWQARRTAHEDRVDTMLAAHLDRHRRGQAHPVEDFLFGKVKITNTLSHQRSDQQQCPGQGSKYRTWSHA